MNEVGTPGHGRRRLQNLSQAASSSPSRILSWTWTLLYHQPYSISSCIANFLSFFCAHGCTNSLWHAHSIRSCFRLAVSSRLHSVLPHSLPVPAQGAFTAPSGRLLFFTTASTTKKRKLVPRGEAANSQGESQTTVPALNEGSGLASPRSSPTLTSNLNRRTSASPPRYLPPHLHDEVREASQTIRQTSPESQNTGGLSPSEAYAGLTLESQEQDKELGGPGSKGTVPATASSPKRVPLRGYEPSPEGSEHGRTLPRASSPAKRLFSDMDQGSKNLKEAMDVDERETDLVEQVGAANSPQPKSASSSPSKTTAGAASHKRGTSVEMMKDRASTQEDNASSGTTPSSNQDTGTSPTSYAADSPSQPVQEDAKAIDSVMTDRAPIPSFDEQAAEITGIAMAPLEENQEGYAVSSSWLSKPLSRTAEGLKNSEYKKEDREGDIGPIDNSDLASRPPADDLKDERGHPFVPLRRDRTMNHDYEMLPALAWEKLVAWYGIQEGSPLIRRYVQDTTPEGATSQNLQYELHPPIMTIRKLRNDQTGTNVAALKDTNKDAPKILASQNSNFQKFLAEAKEKAGIDLKTKVKVWRVIEDIAATEDLPARSGMLTPATSRSGSPAAPTTAPAIRPKLLIDLNTFTGMEEGAQREMVDIKDETANEKYNGHLTLSTVGLSMSQVLILEEQIGGPAGGEFVSDNANSTAAKHGVSLNNKSGAGKTLKPNASASRGSSPAPSGAMTRGRTRRDGKTRGTVGLTNLGNTCYMNSALQCIRSCEELSLYFLQGKYKEEINCDNPLGHNGVLAKTYASLLASIYDDNSMSSFAPRNFKATLGRLSSTFSGYQQQDSQEFLSFLVDGLHEDLNRIIKKPYMENPESTDDTHKDPKLIKALGETYRSNHRARNDSVAMDLFSGFYKNTMVCPDCDKVSITFDPYSLLTLQLPVEQMWQHEVTFFPIRGRPVRVQVDVDKNASMRAIKDFIAQKFPGVKSQRLVIAEIYSHKFYKIFEDGQRISENNIQARDDIAVYELSSVPTNFPPPKKKKSKSSFWMDSKSSEEDVPVHESPLARYMLVPVYHRAQSRSNYSSSRSLALEPFFIIISRSDASNFDEILRKVLAKVATMTTTDLLAMGDEFGGLGSNSSSDAVLTTEDDASSLGPNVTANSVEGEGSIVDVTMSETLNEVTDDMPNSQIVTEEAVLPEVLQNGAFIPPELQRLFVMRYIKSNGKEMIATGYSTIQPHDDPPTILSRIPTARDSRRSSVNSHGSVGTSGSASTEDTQSEQPQHSFNNPDDSDGSLPPPEKLINKGRHKGNKYGKRNGNRGGKKLRTYGRHKGRYTRQSREESVPEQPEPPSDPESPQALIRLGEAIVLDWENEVFDSLFGATSGEADELRGQNTWDLRELFDDPELTLKRETRSKRKKNGVSLEECFSETAKSETLSEENAWYCNNCKELRRAQKTLEIWTAPDILVLHLKRFSSNRAFRDKVDVLVDFPIHGLDISQWVGLPEDKNLVYDLFAIDNHYGGLGGGHYTAFAQNFYDKKWYEYNDSSVSHRKPESCITTAAYLLFYRRRTDTPLGPPYLQDLVNEARDPPMDHPDSKCAENNSANTDSSAGNGQRARDLSHTGANGSSSASAGAVVGADSTKKATTNGAEAAVSVTQYRGGASSDDRPPAYHDEGYEDENTNLQSLTGGMNYNHAGWSFDGVASKDGDDGDSTRQMNGSDAEGSDLEDRLLDFERDSLQLLARGAAAQVTPDHSVNADDLPMLSELSELEDSYAVDGFVHENLNSVVDSMEYDVGGKNDEDDEVVDIVVSGTDKGDKLD